MFLRFGTHPSTASHRPCGVQDSPISCSGSWSASLNQTLLHFASLRKQPRQFAPSAPTSATIPTPSPMSDLPMTSSIFPLPNFLIEEQRAGRVNPQLRLLIEVVSRACKRISIAVGKGALGAIMWAMPAVNGQASINVQGEAQKKLDVLSNEILLEANAWGGHLAGLASEEMDTSQPIRTNIRAAIICCCSTPWMAAPISTSTCRWAPFSRCCAAPRG